MRLARLLLCMWPFKSKKKCRCILKSKLRSGPYYSTKPPLRFGGIIQLQQHLLSKECNKTPKKYRDE